MDSRKLFYFAGQCLMLDEMPELRAPVAAALSSGEIPHERLTFLCDYNLVLPPVYRNLREHGLTRFLDPELIAHFAEIHALNKARNKDILLRIEAINSILGSHGITPVYLKGAAHLLDNLYTDPGDRILTDIDLLVEKEHYLQTARILLDSGYETSGRYYDDVLRMKDYPRLRRKGSPASIEVHQMPVCEQFTKRFDADTLLARKRPVPGWPNCFVPCDEHQIALNFIHSQLSNHGHRFKVASLRNIYDLRLLAKKAVLNEVVPLLEEKEKAEGYFLFAARTLGLGRKLYYTTSRNARRHCILSDLALKHPRIARLRIKLLKSSDLVFKRYAGKLLTALFRQSDRKYILNRISHPGWYKEHFKGLKQYFKN